MFSPSKVFRYTVVVYKDVYLGSKSKSVALRTFQVQMVYEVDGVGWCLEMLYLLLGVQYQFLRSLSLMSSIMGFHEFNAYNTYILLWVITDFQT